MRAIYSDEAMFGGDEQSVVITTAVEDDGSISVVLDFPRDDNGTWVALSQDDVEGLRSLLLDSCTRARSMA